MLKDFTQSPHQDSPPHVSIAILAQSSDDADVRGGALTKVAQGIQGCLAHLMVDEEPNRIASEPQPPDAITRKGVHVRQWRRRAG
jgi:hypothetical protein